MYIKSIVLNNFRNYDKIKLNLYSGVNIIYGNNAQGKTNILEAIYLCATSRSHRTSSEKDLIKWGENQAHIQLLLNKKRDELIDFSLSKNSKKSVAINRLSIRKVSELFGILNVILFSPEDLGLIKKGPKERRRFLDIELCQLDPIYFYNLQQYHLVLKQRNNLLKNMYFNNTGEDTLSIWDDQLVVYGKKIIEIRKNFIDKLNEIVLDIHKNISGGEKLRLKYDCNVEGHDFHEKLIKNAERDKKLKNTLVGPHKDDIIFLINDMDVRTFGSQGQQRTAALSIKLAEIELVKEVTNDTPVLLLDDVLSELDENRQKYLLNSIKDVQTIITCTGIEDFVKKDILIDGKFKIEMGKNVDICK